jgi:hypothetical protein
MSKNILVKLEGDLLGLYAVVGIFNITYTAPLSDISVPSSISIIQTWWQSVVHTPISLLLHELYPM